MRTMFEGGRCANSLIEAPMQQVIKEAVGTAEQQGGRASWDPSRSLQRGCGNHSSHAPSTPHKDLGRRKNSRRLEARFHYQAPQKRRRNHMPKLSRHHDPISSYRQGTEQNNFEENDSSGGWAPKSSKEEQAGFRAERSGTDQTAVLRIITEQCLEWNTSLYINFIDFKKAFDSLDGELLWALMRHYGIPEYINIIRTTYYGMTPFRVITGVRQGCLLSPFLFLLAVDWVMKETTKGRRNSIQWNLTD